MGSEEKFLKQHEKLKTGHVIGKREKVLKRNEQSKAAIEVLINMVHCTSLGQP